MALYCFVTIFM